MPAMPALPPDAAVEALDTGLAKTEQPAPEVDAEAEPDRDALPSVTIDDLLDLQQQAEFFSVLGQEDAALKLLSEHLRQTRGDYPLPYLQLMDTYRRRADLAGFERVRSRFQRRFGLAWPDGHQPVQGHRYLEDCPDVLWDIERVWQDPAQAMLTLEHMLRSGDRLEALEPTVQGELLFLYTLARDLRDQPAPVSAHVPVTPPAPAPVPTPVYTPMPSEAPLAVGAISGAANPAKDLDLELDLELDLDLDLNLGMDHGPASSAGLDLALDFDAPPVRAAAGPPQPLPVIDLPLVGAESGLGAPAARPAAPTPGSQALSLEFPDLDVPAAKALAVAQAAAVDLELSFDSPDLAALPPPLSAHEQIAASRFSLFSEEFDQMKKR
jgi:hypothetical protein